MALGNACATNNLATRLSNSCQPPLVATRLELNEESYMSKCEHLNDAQYIKCKTKQTMLN